MVADRFARLGERDRNREGVRVVDCRVCGGLEGKRGARRQRNWLGKMLTTETRAGV